MSRERGTHSRAPLTGLGNLPLSHLKEDALGVLREGGREREDHRYEYDRIVDEMAAALPPSVLPWAPKMRVHFD